MKSRCVQSLFSFNGTAPVKVRKSETDPDRTAAPAQLQWDRTREGAEVREGELDRLAEIIASMGPHP